MLCTGLLCGTPNSLPEGRALLFIVVKEGKEREVGPPTRLWFSHVEGRRIEGREIFGRGERQEERGESKK
eukprot:scaffold191572_cov18-Tisochrysis_lutea.AAC.1